MLEVGVFGTLTLLALAFMIQVGLRMSYQQEIQQQSFRHALRVAQSEGDDESPAISYSAFRDRQLPDPTDGFSFVPRTLTQGSASVTWGENLDLLDKDSQPRLIIDLNSRSPSDWRQLRGGDLKFASKANPQADCPAYFYDCINGCDEDDEDVEDCIDGCRNRQNDRCTSLPLIAGIEKETTVEASEGRFAHRNGTFSSRVATVTSDKTTLKLNTRNEASVTSEVRSGVGFQW